MKKYLILFALVFSMAHSWAQESINQPLVDYLKNLDHSQIPIGILKEWGFPLFDIGYYNGIALDDSNAIDANRFGWLYMQLTLGNMTDRNSFPAPNGYMDLYKPEYEANTSLPIAILNYRYNYIRADALSRNLVYVNNGVLYDTPNRTASPYGESNAFAATTLSTYSNQANMRFVVPTHLYFSNQTSSVQSLQLDLDNGGGYQTVAFGQEISIRYTQNGSKDIKVKLILSNGTTLISHTKIEVNDPSLVLSQSPNGPLDIYGNDPNENIDITVMVNNKPIKAQINIFYHCSSLGMQKPFIFIEGFDPKLDGVGLTYDEMRKRLVDELNMPPDSTSMWERLYDEGYDLIYVDFGDGMEDLRSNAQVVKEVIRRVNRLKNANGSREHTVVLGASMGGVIGKWALREMERAGELHEVSKFISMDSPLKGANVPLGIQFMIQDLANRKGAIYLYRSGPISFNLYKIKEFKLSEYIPIVKLLEGLFQRPATKQMLYYNAWADNNNYRQFHDAFYAELEALGNLEQIEHIKISNGSGIGQSQLLNAGEQYVKIFGEGTTPQRTGIGQSSIDVRVLIDLEIKAIPASGNGQIYSGNIQMRLPIGVSELFRIQMTNRVSGFASNLKPFDSAPGGFSNFGFPYFTNRLSFDNVTITANFGAKTAGLWSFIPTFSALDMAEPNNINTSFSCANCFASLNANAKSNDVLVNGGFAHNQDHVSINLDNYNFLLSKIEKIGLQLNTLTILNRTFNYGKSSQFGLPNQVTTYPYISNGLTIDNGNIWVNRNGKIGFIDENNLLNQSNSTYKVYLVRNLSNCIDNTTSLTVQNNGSVILGDNNVGNVGKMYITKNTVMEIKSTANLVIDPNSELIIEQGGKLILEGGANVVLNGKIVIKQGGELIVNGQFNHSGSGYFEFDEGHILRQAAPIVLRGGGSAVKLIQLNRNAQLAFTNTVNLSNGLILYDNYAGISQNTGDLTLSNLYFRPGLANINQVAYHAQNVGNVNVTDVNFKWLYKGLIINNLGNATISNTNFIDCTGDNLIVQNGNTVKLNQVNISGFGNSGNHPIGIDLSQLKDARLDYVSISPYLNSSNNAEVQAVYGIKLTDVPIFRFYNSNISYCQIGIKANQGRNNIDMKLNSTISNCSFGILLNGERQPSGITNYGRLTMSCSNLLDNGWGISGRDIELNIDASVSSGNKSNVFRNGITIGGGQPRQRNVLFALEYTYDIPFIKTTNNFWTNGFLAGDFFIQTPNGYRSFITSPIAQGVPVYCVAPSLGSPRTDPNCPPPCFTGGNSTDENSLTIDGEVYNLEVQYKEAYLDFDNGYTNESYEKFEPLTEISDIDYAMASDLCKKYIDVSKTMIKSDGLRSGSSKWLAKAKVAKNKVQDIDKLVLYPNPARDYVQLNIEIGNYKVTLTDALGKDWQTFDSQGITNIEVDKLPNGIYFVNVENKDTRIIQKAKIIVSH